jgi:hypothetical protein
MGGKKLEKILNRKAIKGIESEKTIDPPVPIP